MCGALLPTIGTVTGGFSVLLVKRLLDLPLVIPCHSPDGLDAACVRKPPYCPCQAFVLCVDVFHIGIEVMDLLLDVGLVLLDPP